MRQPATAAGRKRGKANRKMKQKVEHIEEPSLTLLDYMLSVIRNPRAKPERRDEMAKAAAAYAHPQLAPIDIQAMRLIGTLLAEIFEKLKS